MHLKRLQLLNFKNYEEVDVDLSEGINCFIGNNGEGKTNLLDAVYYLSMCKSYMNPVDKQNIRFEQPFFSIQGDWEKNQEIATVQCVVKTGVKKRFRRNKKDYEKLADHIGLYPVVMISPYDRDLISEGSEIRRRWMDGIISQFDRQYLNDVQRYVKVLEQRNALLKNMAEHQLFDPESIEVWDVQLVEIGNRIYAKRKKFIEEFVPVFAKHYESIGLTSEHVEVVYRSHLNDAEFSSLLDGSKRKDAQTRFTNVGIHRDDLIFQIKENPVKRFGSQGQQKSFLIALRLAQYEWLKNHLNTLPVLLLDDIFDKLDHDRVERLIRLVSDHFFGQVLVTDTDEDRVVKIFSAHNLNHRLYKVDQGDVTELVLS